MSTIILKQKPRAQIPTPDTDKLAFFVNEDDQRLESKDSNGVFTKYAITNGITFQQAYNTNPALTLDSTVGPLLWKDTQTISGGTTTVSSVAYSNQLVFSQSVTLNAGDIIVLSNGGRRIIQIGGTGTNFTSASWTGGTAISALTFSIERPTILLRDTSDVGRITIDAKTGSFSLGPAGSLFHGATGAFLAITGSGTTGSTQSSVIRMQRYSDNAFSPSIGIGKARGTSLTPAVVQANDTLGQIDFLGWVADPVNTPSQFFGTGARISFVAEAAPTSTVVPTYINISTVNTSNSFAERMRITADGRVGIGIVPTSNLHVFSTSNLTSGSYTYTNLQSSANPSSASTALYRGALIQTGAASNTASTMGRVYALETWAWADSAGTTQTIDEMASIVFSTYPYNGGINVTDLYGITGYAATNGTSTATNAYGMRVSVNQSGGTITNSYGILIGNVQGTNKWSMYVTDSAAPSYFAAGISIGYAQAARAPLDTWRNTAGIHPGAILENYANSSGDGTALDFYRSGDHRARIAAVKSSSTNETDIVFSAFDNTSVAQRMVLKGDTGNLGIGTNTPTSKLEVNGDIALVDGMTAPSATSGKAKIYVDSADGALKVIFGDGTVKVLAHNT